MDWLLGLPVGFILGVATCVVVMRAARARSRAEVEGWRTRYQTEQLERAKWQTQAERLASLETELQQGRVRLEALSIEKSRLGSIAERVPDLEARIEFLAEQSTTLGATNAGLQTQLREQKGVHEEKIAALTDVKGGIEKELKSIAVEALRSNQGTFLELANQVFDKHNVGAQADLEARQKSVEALVSPLQVALQTYGRHIEEVERARTHAYGALSSELRSVAETQNAVRTETSKLVQALRAAPKTRGRWGEHTLRNVLELSGLSPYCDFSTQETFERDENKLRPDSVIRLPGGRHLVVDAKTSMSGYLDAVEAIDEGDRERHLVLHAAQLRAHMKELAAKSYWDGLTVTPDFVVMFVPGDNFYAAAVERDPSLFDDAAAKRVIIATPATLIALAKSVAFGWRQEKVAENAQRVHSLGRDLYRRMVALTEHVAKCGDSLGKSVKCFNQFIGSLEHSVMPQARRFNELDVEGTATEIPRLEPIETEPRLLRSDRDFADCAAANEPPLASSM